MNDVTRILSADSLRTSPTTGVVQREPQAFQKTVRGQINEREQAALQRLDSALSQGPSLDRNVPRGTYLNITV